MNDRFTAVLRRHLKLLKTDQELSPDTVLAELGLDSLAAVSLVFDLEDELGVTLPDSAFVGGTFHTAGTLWGALDSQLGSPTAT